MAPGTSFAAHRCSGVRLGWTAPSAGADDDANTHAVHVASLSHAAQHAARSATAAPSAKLSERSCLPYTTSVPVSGASHVGGGDGGRRSTE